MKVGSLVECIKESSDPQHLVEYPLVGSIYTVRAIPEPDYILLEEIDNSHLAPITENDVEPGFLIHRFREVQPPMSLDFINELQTSNA